MAMVSRALIACAVFALAACPAGPRGPDKVSGQGGELVAPVHPRYDPAGERLVVHAGAEGNRHIFVMNADKSERRQLTSGSADHRDPSFSPDGRHVIFAANSDGDYDLYLIDSQAAKPQPVRVTDLPGDELGPTMSSLRYGFYAVGTDGCSPDNAGGHQIDGYEKVVFTRRWDGKSEVWFASVKPADDAGFEAEKISAHATHTGRLSPDGKACGEPSFSGDGLSIAWTCDENGPVIYDTRAEWEQSFADALLVVDAEEDKALTECTPDAFNEAKCFANLPRRYTRHPGKAVSRPDDGVRRPAYSANQILIAGDAGRRVLTRHRLGSATWQPLTEMERPLRDVTWKPDGSGIAYSVDLGAGAGDWEFKPTDLYLQSVRNLHEFPELHVKGESKRLHANHFVARPGNEREFYALYEKLRYRRRPQFITADAALQVFRDEFQEMLQSAEERAADDLRKLGRHLMDVYAARWARSKSATDRYYAVYFATGWVPLEAAAKLDKLSDDDYFEREMGDDDKQLKERFARLSQPAIERIPGKLDAALAQVNARLRGDVSGHVRNMLGHAGIGDLEVPGRARPARVDWSQFKVRGSYADSALAGYFLAMNWYAQAPLPFDASLAQLTKSLKRGKIGRKSAYDVWSRIDAVVSSFMGKPVDATMAHLNQVAREQPALLKRFNAKRLQKRLAELRGPMPLRDAEATESGGAGRKIQVSFFPKRMGLDTTFFRKLTHPDVPGRGFPSAVDVMAVLGSERAQQHGQAAAKAKAWADAYRKTLKKLASTEPTPERAPGYFSTDLYHSWLAALAVLAHGNDVPADSVMRFARSEAWHDRRLYSALAGYTQLKHSAVLYAMQDMSAECDSADPFYVAIEQPLLPTPRGFVDPMPSFFAALAKLAENSYQKLHKDPKGPAAQFWYYFDDDDTDRRLNAASFARALEGVARDQIAGKPLTKQQLTFIEYAGPRLEAITLGMNPQGQSIAMGGDQRGERGIALVTDVHTNLTRQQVLQLGVGRIMSLFVAVPDRVGHRMTQGGMFSFYEFYQSMSDRLTDDQWAKRIDSKKLPPRPRWSESFIEDVP